MKRLLAASIILLVSLLILAGTNVTQAEWNAINSGYGVTTNYHDIDVPLGEHVIATAGTTDERVTSVNFTWKKPDGTIAQWEVVPVSDEPLTAPEVPGGAPEELTNWANKHLGIQYWYAQDKYVVEGDVGWWTVKATFILGDSKAESQDKFRATSFFAIDEVPFGTIILLITPFGFACVYAIKKKHSNHIKTRMKMPT